MIEVKFSFFFMTCLQLALMQSTCQEMAMEQGGERDLRLGDDKFS